MSLHRAFTTRRAKQPSVDMGSAPQRSNTVTRGHGYSGSIRNKISAPMELTHTTNMLAYNAPDLYPRTVSTTSSTKSDDDSDSAPTSASSPPTSPDIPSTAHGRSASPEPNHLSCYFTAPGQKLPATISEAPKIPQRAPSHTKKSSFDNLASKNSRFSNQSSQSTSTKSSFALSRSSSTSTTATSFSSGSISRKPSIPSVPEVASLPIARSNTTYRRTAERAEAQHPFGQELAQVSEIAEDYGVKEKLNVIDEEEKELVEKGLCRFRPDDYLAEIQGLFATFLRPEPAAEMQQTVWI